MFDKSLQRSCAQNVPVILRIFVNKKRMFDVHPHICAGLRFPRKIQNNECSGTCLAQHQQVNWNRFPMKAENKNTLCLLWVSEKYKGTEKCSIEMHRSHTLNLIKVDWKLISRWRTLMFSPGKFQHVSTSERIFLLSHSDEFHIPTEILGNQSPKWRSW